MVWNNLRSFNEAYVLCMPVETRVPLVPPVFLDQIVAISTDEASVRALAELPPGPQ